jgi:hypothetical protein
MKVTACSCQESGWCERHRCFKHELHFQLCRRRPDYFQAWEEGRGPGQGETASAWVFSSLAQVSDPATGTARVSEPAETVDRKSPESPSTGSFLARPPCRHRGAVIATRECAACQGRVRLKLFRCELHGSCTTTRTSEGAACCGHCEGYEPPLSASQKKCHEQQQQ